MNSVCYLALFLLLVSPHNDGLKISYSLLSKDVLVFEENLWYGHLVAVKSEEGIVVIDTFPSPRLAREARQIIEREFPHQPIRYVIYTDSHWDHNAGNHVFADSLIIGHVNSVDGLCFDASAAAEGFLRRAERLSHDLEKFDPQSSEAKKIKHEIECMRQLAIDLQEYQCTYPKIALENGASLKVGNKTFKIRYYGPAHTTSDLSVFVPEEGLLVTGDLVFSRFLPAFSVEDRSDILNNINALDEMISLGDRVRHVVPGHGPVGKNDVLLEYKALLENLYKTVDAAIQQGLTADQAMLKIKLEKYSSYELYSEEYVNYLVGECWKLLENAEK